MNDFKERTGASPSPAGSMELLQVITALNLVRMNLGMYPPGHTRISESIDNAFDILQKILRKKAELLVGFDGDKNTFGETAPDKEKKSAAFRDYARSLNDLRIVSFTLHRGLKKGELLEFNRILAAKSSDIWALGKIESVFAGAGITGIKVKVIDADHFHLQDKKELIQTRADQVLKDANFWQKLFDRLELEALKRSQSDGILTDEVKIDPVEAIRFLNKQKENWASAVFSYEKMVNDYLSKIPKGVQVSTEDYETLTGVNSLVSDLNPELKKQLVEVVERQFTLHQDTALVEENLKCFPSDIFKEVIRQTDERGSHISPTLVNLLKKMAGTHDEEPASPDQVKEQEFSSKNIETLLKREQYEEYVPEDYDRLLQKATASSAADEDIDEFRFPLQEYLKTLTYEHVDFQICQSVHSLMDEQISEEVYLACSGKLARSIPELLKRGHFSFLTAVMETLRRHSNEKTGNIRQEVLPIIKSLSERETIARYVTPFILSGTEEPAVLTEFLVSSGVQNLPWLSDLYLDPKTPVSATITVIMKGFGKNATEEAVKRLPGQDSNTIIRLLTFIREMDDRSVASSLNDLFHHEDWTVRRELIKTLIVFDDPAVIELLRKSLKAENQDEVLEAVGLSCLYRVVDLLEDLTSMLKTVVIREENSILNEWIAGELAKTGHKSVIPHLEKIAATWFSLSPKYLTGTKVALYRNLNHFPKNQVQKLLKLGNRSRNKEIRTICAKILKSKE
ncbi:MAG: HEAT repeat domain-containing protein [Proteobacteria bacterium]|nr:HEAT repeat domain-containing protein [Pseudomonadota bacterium]